MTKIGHNGWLQVNIEAKDPNNLMKPLEFTTSHGSLMELPFKDAADYTAQLISKKYDNIHLLLSGGLDSEFVAHTLIKNDIPFKPVILVFKNSLSESWYAFKFCDENNITPIVIDLQDYVNADKFMKTLLQTALKWNIPPVMGLFPLVIADMYPDAHILNGFGEVFRTSPVYQNQEHDDILDLSFNQHSVEVVYGDKHPGAFFTYTPEIVYSSIVEFDYTVNSQVAKSNLYKILQRSKMDISDFEGCYSDKMYHLWMKVINRHKLKETPEHYKYFIKSNYEWLEFLKSTTLSIG